MIRKFISFLIRIFILLCVLALVGVAIYVAFFQPVATINNVEQVIPLK